MTNRGHQGEQHYVQGDPWGPQQAGNLGADGPVRAFGMGGEGAAAPQPQADPAYQQPYGYPGQQPYGHPAYQQMPYGQPAYPGHAPMQPMYRQPATSQPVRLKQKRGRKVFWIAIAIAILCVVLAVVLFLTLGGQSGNRQGTKGQLEGKTPEEIQAELNRQVEEGMFNISIASVVEFADGTSEGELRIENVPGNNYLMKVDISRDDTGDVVYTSGMIEPDYHVQRDALDVDLDAGTYPCTAVFTAYDPATEQQIGQAAAKITVQVKG